MSVLGTKMNSRQFLILGLMCGMTILFWILSNENVVEPSLWNITAIPIGSGFPLAWSLYMSGSFITAVSAFLVARKYRGSAMFTKAYFCLGLGFCFWFIGDALFSYDAYVQELPTYYEFIIQGNEPFKIKSFDLAYLGVYPSMALHLYLNTNWFEKNKLKIMKKTGLTKFFLFGIPIIGAMIYFHQYSSFNSIPIVNAFNVESIFGSLNAVGSSVTLGLVIWGAKTFRASSLSPAWTLLLAGIFFSTVGDYLYYQVEHFNGDFMSLSLSTPFYLLMYMIMNYGLYKHIKTI